MKKDILIIGKPNASKTVFLSQLYTRLEKRKSKLKLDKSLSNITVISDARIAIANGDSPETTRTKGIGNLLISAKYDDDVINLEVPDYGGEQINEIINSRDIHTNWHKAIIKSNNWILFIRLSNIQTPFDLSNKTISEEHTDKTTDEEENREYSISHQSSFIELIQMFLHIKKHDYHTLNRETKLTIVLTCWDELNLENGTIPETKLKEELPLLLDFIKSNFETDFYKVLGLSAQEFPLNTAENKEKYQIDGAESFGYYIKEDGSKSNDITELIIEAI